jgi:hypothetical protein
VPSFRFVVPFWSEVLQGNTSYWGFGWIREGVRTTPQASAGGLFPEWWRLAYPVVTAELRTRGMDRQQRIWSQMVTWVLRRSQPFEFLLMNGRDVFLPF